MFQNSGSFYWFFFSADLRKNKRFLLAESPFFCCSHQQKKNRSKRPAEKNHYFGTCKPANCILWPAECVITKNSQVNLIYARVWQSFGPIIS